MVKNFRVAKKENKACIVDIPTMKIIEDSRTLDAYKFAHIWTTAVDHKNTFINPKDGKMHTTINNDGIDRLYSDDTLKQAYVVFI